MFQRLTTFILILLLVLTLGACSKTKKGDGSGDGTALSDEDIALQNTRFGEGNIPIASAGGPFRDVLFDYDSSQVAERYLTDLQQYASLIKADPALRVEVEGHCDKRGTTEYNMALGERRSKAVAAILTRFGAPPSQLSIVSYGEEILLDPGDSESSHAKNRRVHFAVFKSK